MPLATSSDAPPDGAYLEPPLSAAVVDGRRMTWREAGVGDATPLFLMHGVGTNARLWAGQFAGFAAGRRVVAWNAPGYAGSERLATATPSPGDYGRAALALMDHLGLETCILIGQSLGSIMATDIALRAPERVKGLALTSPIAGYAAPPGGPYPETIASRLRDAAGLTPEALAARRAPRLLGPNAGPRASAIVHQAMSEVDPEGYAQAVRMLAEADLPAMVGRVRAPMLVMWGDADVVTPPEECRRIAEAASAPERRELHGVGHAMAAEDPEAFNAVLRPFIAWLEARSESR